MKNLYSIFVAFISVFAVAQEIKTEMPNVMGPSPSVASLMKFEEVEVSNYTGIPNISIPLFSSPTHSKDIAVDISLNYHSGGVGLKEHSGDVGLGWALMAGGSISRTVRGFPDEYYKTGQPSKMGIYQNATYDQVSNNYYDILDAVLHPENADPQDLENLNEYYWNGQVRGWLDTEHDLWQFNFMAFSGRFYIEKNSSGLLEVKPLDDYRLKIVNHYNTNPNFGDTFKYTPTSFEIYDDKGYRYVFSTAEITNAQDVVVSTAQINGLPEPSFDRTITYKSAFHLTEVWDNNDNKIINITYHDELMKENAVDRATINTYQKITSALQTFNNSACGGGALINFNPPPRTITYATYKRTNVKKIEDFEITGIAKLNFDYQQGRVDGDFDEANNAYVLKGILVKDWYGNVKKKISLEQINSGYKNRMKLSKVMIGTVSEPGIETYEMEYTPSVDDDQLPEDPWGFATAPNPILPEATNYKATTADLLLKMILPTGGCRVFDFEQNRYSYIGSDEITDFDENNENWVGNEIDYTFTALSSSNYPSATTFTITDEQDVHFEVNVNTGSTPVYAWRYNIKKTGGGIAAIEVDAGTYPNNDCNDGECSRTIHLMPGEYKISFDSDTPFDFPSNFTAYIKASYKTRATVVKEYLFGGGNRIKRISYFEDDVNADDYIIYGTPDPTKEVHFDYTLFSDASKSSGSLAYARPVFEYDRYKDECIWCNSSGGGHDRQNFGYRVHTKQNSLHSLRTQGSDVGYRNVKVYETGNGRTEYTYSSPLTVPENLTLYNLAPPFMPSENFDYKRGLLEKEEVFNQAGDILRKTELEYSVVDYLATTGIKLYYESEFAKGFNSPTYFNDYMDDVAYCGSNSNSLACFCDFDIPDVFISALPVVEAYGWAKLISKDTYQYFYENSTQRAVYVAESFEYNSINKKLAWKTSTGSLGETIKTEYYYHTGNAIGHFNRISEIEQIKTFNNNDLVSDSKIIYDNSQGVAQPWWPQKIQSAKGTQAMVDKVIISKYDEFGNPLVVEQPGGLKTCYIWGYNDSQPVAKIENIEYLNIPAQSITDIKTHSNANNTSSLLNDFTTLRNHANLTYSFVTNYAYEPLSGVSVAIDPKGMKTTYAYDSFGRLQFVRDQDNNILSENKYNYRVSQTAGQNFVKTGVYKIATQSALSASPPAADASVSVSYIDGLGRLAQTVSYKRSNTGKDIVTPVAYDNYGRQAIDFLPVPLSSATMAFRDETTLASAYASYHQYSGQPAFSEKLFESSPLNRVMKQSAPGSTWQMGSGHEIRMEYQCNTLDPNTTDDDEVKMYNVTTLWDSTRGLYGATLTNSSGTTFYPEGKLFKTITRNENWSAGQTDIKDNTTEEFKNVQGQIVLKRAFDDGERHDTYYVYDIYGNLSFVIPPLADGATTLPNDLCYQYLYDHRNRLVEKKMPDRNWEYIVYDKLDRVAATGPTRRPFLDTATEDGWSITKYDVFNRVVLTGWVHIGNNWNSAGRVARQSVKDGETTFSEVRLDNTPDVQIPNGGVTVRYTNSVWPTSGHHVLSVNYFDDYRFPAAVTFSGSVESQAISYDNTNRPKTLPTGSWTRVITTSGAFRGQLSQLVYDNKGRVIRNRFRNHETGTGGVTLSDTRYNFTGRTEYTITSHNRTASSTTTTVRKNFSYSDQDRPTVTTMQVPMTAAEQLISSNLYDELGQLVTKSVGNAASVSTPLQQINYSYNIRGWLTAINDISNLSQSGAPNDLFAFKINYDTVENETGYTGKELFNGNISETYWRTASDNVQRKYGYFYDSLNRLTGASFQHPGIAVLESYDEYVTYDMNGNIQRMTRNGDVEGVLPAIEIDDLIFDYYPNSNRLRSVTETTPSATSGFYDGNIGVDYPSYDDQGNMLRDLNKGMSADIRYNHMNLPQRITFPNGTIEYTYDAMGRKIEKLVSVTGSPAVTTKYLEGFQYVNDALQFFPTPEGYVTRISNTIFRYVFNYTDHLGNIRLKYSDANNDGVITTTGVGNEIIEENNYYPFGMSHSGYNSLSSPNNLYKYNGKELQNELSLGWYDYGARNYDPTIGRWLTIDPKAELARKWSPFTYCYDNPIRFIDPDGMFAQEGGIDVGYGRIVSAESSSMAFDYYNYGDSDIGDNKGKKAKKDSKDNSKNRNSLSASYIKIDTSKLRQVQSGYVGESLDILATKGIQWLASELTGSSVSESDAQLIQLFTALATLYVSKGKNGEGLSSIFSYWGRQKIINDMAQRGWSKELLHKTINSPFTTRSAFNKATGNNATAYYMKSGAYVVRDNVSGEVIQVSNRFDPSWAPDSSIINPFIPK